VRKNKCCARCKKTDVNLVKMEIQAMTNNDVKVGKKQILYYCDDCSVIVLQDLANAIKLEGE